MFEKILPFNIIIITYMRLQLMNIFCLFNYPFVLKLSDWQHSYTLDSLAHHWTQQHMKHHFYAHVSAIIVTETHVQNKLCELCRSKIAFITNKITKVQYCFCLPFLQYNMHAHTQTPQSDTEKVAFIWTSDASASQTFTASTFTVTFTHAQNKHATLSTDPGPHFSTYPSSTPHLILESHGYCGPAD